MTINQYIEIERSLAINKKKLPKLNNLLCIANFVLQTLTFDANPMFVKNTNTGAVIEVVIPVDEL